MMKTYLKRLLLQKRHIAHTWCTHCMVTLYSNSSLKHIHKKKCNRDRREDIESERASRKLMAPGSC